MPPSLNDDPDGIRDLPRMHHLLLSILPETNKYVYFMFLTSHSMCKETKFPYFHLAGN